MSKRAIYQVSVDGRDVSSVFRPILISLGVALRDGEQGDMASLTLDDTGGQIAMPATGARIVIALGWVSSGMRVVFEGTVDEVRCSGGRSGGRTLTVSAKGFDAAGRAKEPQRRHWDNATVLKILQDACTSAGVADVAVDPDLASVEMKYWAMTDESLLHMGQRLARRIGGDFQVQGGRAVMARRASSYSPTITAAAGANLHDWDISPVLGRKVYGKVRADFFDRQAGRWDKVEVDTGLESDAVLVLTPAATDRMDAQRQAEAKAEASKREAGGGWVNVEGDSAVVPGCACIVVGARPGIDRSYRVIAVSHSLNRSGGFVTNLELGHPDALPQ